MGCVVLPIASVVGTEPGTLTRPHSSWIAPGVWAGQIARKVGLSKVSVRDQSTPCFWCLSQLWAGQEEPRLTGLTQGQDCGPGAPRRGRRRGVHALRKLVEMTREVR